ncbi:hypothetical protein LTR97_012473 [Elasticomyces elasticus]|uniref:Uncharacterized protein n=1 Tax=Elasticomyces elasticus TaxID=574655 RepID=A0AAN7ZY14_9PEZI|nr:hypothetical protein LTR97_012473 [Elasticomyces elasticus]
MDFEDAMAPWRIVGSITAVFFGAIVHYLPFDDQADWPPVGIQVLNLACLMAWWVWVVTLDINLTSGYLVVARFLSFSAAMQTTTPMTWLLDRVVFRLDRMGFRPTHGTSSLKNGGIHSSTCEDPLKMD